MELQVYAYLLNSFAGNFQRLQPSVQYQNIKGSHIYDILQAYYSMGRRQVPIPGCEQRSCPALGAYNRHKDHRLEEDPYLSCIRSVQTSRHQVKHQVF